MGLDTSHDAWHGAYSAFMRWRTKIAAVAGIPPLNLMEGFFERDTIYDPIKEHAAVILTMRKNLAEQGETVNVDDLYEGLPIRWDSLKPSSLHELLYHSDCDGHIGWKSCGKIADSLEALLPKLADLPDNPGHIGNWKEKTEKFIKGLRKAHAAKERLEFH